MMLTVNAAWRPAPFAAVLLLLLCALEVRAEDARDTAAESTIGAITTPPVSIEGEVIVGTGTTVKQAQTQAYQRIKNIMIPNMYYRTDIGDRWVEDSDKLHNWGYLREN